MFTQETDFGKKITMNEQSLGGSAGPTMQSAVWNVT